MGHTGFSSFAHGPVLNALRHPLRTFMHSKAIPGHEGRMYVGHGEPVIVFPMFGEGPPSTARLRQTLAEAGFTPYDWGLGVDDGPGRRGLKRHLRKLEEQVIEAFEAERQPLTLLGWGLSGLYARETAKRLSPLVRQVITLGTPITHSAEWGNCRLFDALTEEFRSDPALRQRLGQRPPVPCTAIYSMSDGVVPWSFCVETESLTSENIAIAQATHLELADHPKALEIITHRLAQPDGAWRAFDA
jgi:hypothetical protein